MGNNKKVDHWPNSKKFFNNGCPFCQSNDFLKGPGSGLSVNFKCAQCKATFNNTGPFGIDLLSESE